MDSGLVLGAVRGLQPLPAGYRLRVEVALVQLDEQTDVHWDVLALEYHLVEEQPLELLL